MSRTDEIHPAFLGASFELHLALEMTSMHLTNCLIVMPQYSARDEDPHAIKKPTVKWDVGSKAIYESTMMDQIGSF